jgi:hypothetical protein
MPSTGYDRDAERIDFTRGPHWRRTVALAVFVLAVIAGALLASLAKDQENHTVAGPVHIVDGDTIVSHGIPEYVGP